MSNVSPYKLSLSETPVIILAGGLGTRLRPVLKDKPKILAPIQGRAFLYWQLDWLYKQGVRQVIFSLGYEAEQIIEALQNYQQPELKIKYVVEPELLGTLGGIAFSSSGLHTAAIVCHGDSFCNINLQTFHAAVQKHHITNKPYLGMVASYHDNCIDFGRIELDASGWLQGFKEKQQQKPGWINAGIYWLSAVLISKIQGQTGSFETQILSNKSYPSWVFTADQQTTIDIGTVNRYQQIHDRLGTDMT